MPYTALPDRRMPYDIDGTIVYQSINIASGMLDLASSGTKTEWNDYDYSIAGTWTVAAALQTWWWFPETREVTAFYVFYFTGNTGASAQGVASVVASNDSTNGLDGTWETATLSGGSPAYVDNFNWRSGVKPISLTGPKRTIKIQSAGTGNQEVAIAHIYGEKAAGQTPEDLIFIDHDTTPGVEYAAPEDFGDMPLGTTATRQFRVKNTSATKTANTINIQCNDSDFVISTDNATWVVTINITSLAAGAESSTMYVRCTTPAVGSFLGPRHARIVATVASYT